MAARETKVKLQLLFCNCRRAIGVSMAILSCALASCTRDRDVEQCATLRRVALALHQYHEQFGYFPPQRTKGSDCDTSWRQVLHSFTAGQTQNRGTPVVDGEFISEASGIDQTRDCSVFVVQGSDSLWQADEYHTLDEISDDHSDTMLAVYWDGLVVEWDSVVDLSWSEDRGFYVMTADGSIGVPGVPTFAVMSDGTIVRLGRMTSRREISRLISISED